MANALFDALFAPHAGRDDPFLHLPGGAPLTYAAFLAQAARELLLLESSDWPFLVTTGQANEYAIQRFNEHVERFNQMADLAEAGADLDEVTAMNLDALEDQDNPFPAIDYRVFAARQGHAEVLLEAD